MTWSCAMPEGRRQFLPICTVSAWLALVTVWTGILEVSSQCSREMTEVVNDYLTALRGMDTSGCKLYTPSLTSYDKCPTSTLTCFAEEVKVLIFEFEKDFQNLGLFKDLPKRLMSINIEEDTAQCLQCEIHNEEPVEEFLLRLQRILQLMNSKCV